MTGIGGAVVKRPLLADLGELAVKATAVPGGRLQGGDRAIERPRGGEVRDPFRHHV